MRKKKCVERLVTFLTLSASKNVITKSFDNVNNGGTPF